MPTYLPRRKTKNGEWRYPWRATFQGRKAYGTCPSSECRKDCARKAEIDLRAGKDPATRGLTMSEVIRQYRERYLPTIPDSAELYGRHLDFWDGELGRLLAGRVTAKDLGKARDKLLERPSTKRPGQRLSPMTANRYMQTISSVLSWARRPDVGLCEGDNPAHLVAKLPETERSRWLTRPADVHQVDGEPEAESELERLLAACAKSESPVLYDLVVLLICTACRLGELLSLRRSDVRLADACFTLRAEVTKTEQPGYVPLEGIALDVMRRRLEAPANGSPWVFPRTSTRPADAKTRRGRAGHLPDFPRTAWRNALRAARIPDFRPHDLRHTAMSWARMAGRSLPELMGVGRQRTVKSVMRYAHMAPEHGRRGAADIASTVTAVAGGLPDADLVN